MKSAVPGTIVPTLSIRFHEAVGVGHESYVAAFKSAAFSGTTTFHVAIGELDAFAGALEALDRSLVGEADLRCGWGDTVDFRLRVRPLRSPGRLLAEVEIASDGEGERRHHLRTHMVLPEPGALTRFWRVLGRRDATRAGNVAVLTPAAEPLAAGDVGPGEGEPG